ncbi:hypothetical protein [Legionella brunensis]|uniref:Uncharacterized protein n=1 Tax=Legionella brunensis TaxID=29422 RepID=A0A0W0SDW5_9GAMM|nr:hypothetical protein [Legionella brunensis]KTC81339.1 hypothetical protein Lbru_1859 [Legionella brunensis]
MRPVKIVIYDQTQIQSWENELPTLKKAIDTASQTVLREKQTLEPLNLRLLTLDNEINSIQLQILTIQSELERRHHHHHHEHNGHHHSHPSHNHGNIFEGFADAVSELNLLQLQNQLNVVKIQRGELKKTIQSHLDEIKRAESIIGETSSKIAWTEDHIKAGKQFLETLTNNPAELVEQLHEKILKTFEKYSNTHPAGVSPQVRFCLLNIQAKLAGLLTPPTFELITPSPIQVNQIYYLRLCAFLWDMYYRVERGDNDYPFSDLLANLLKATHILENGDLPDHLQTGQSANVHFSQVKNNNPYFQDLTDYELLAYEKQIFDQEISHTKTRLYRQNALQIHIGKAVSLIELEIANKKSKKEPVDYHFYTQVIRDFNKILFQGSDPSLVDHLALLAEHASGSSSLGKKIGGALLVVAGLLLIAASVVGLVATFGSSAFLSAFGLALALSLLSTSTIAGTGLTFFGGRTFKGGMQQGLSKELHNIHDDLQNPEVAHTQPQYG